MEERNRLDDVSRLPVIYPYWHQLNEVSDRLSEADIALFASHVK